MVAASWCGDAGAGKLVVLVCHTKHPVCGCDAKTSQDSLSALGSFGFTEISTFGYPRLYLSSQRFFFFYSALWQKTTRNSSKAVEFSLSVLLPKESNIICQSSFLTYSLTCSYTHRPPQDLIDLEKISSLEINKELVIVDNRKNRTWQQRSTFLTKALQFLN